jgi:hypothetical protein
MQLTQLEEMHLVEEATEVVKITAETTEQQIAEWVRKYSRLNWGHPLERMWLLERRVAQLEEQIRNGK